MPRQPTDTFACPHCGADVRRGAPACPECGSDEDTGWSEDTMYDGVDFGGYDDDPPLRPGSRAKAGATKIIAVVVLIVIGCLICWGLWPW